MFGAALTQNVDFKCNSAICFGVGGVHDQFKTLQSTINRFSTLGDGFKPLDVDGFIGDLTVAAANTAAKLAALPSPGLTHEAIATNALTFTASLQDFLDTLVILGVIAPTTDAERAKLAAVQQSDTPTPPPANTEAVITSATPSIEIDGTVQKTITACQASRSSPICARAKAMCKGVRGTPQADLAEVKQICNAVQVPLGIWLLAGAIGVGTITGIVLIRRRHRMRAERAELANTDWFTDTAEWWEGRRPGNARAFRRAGFKQVPCDFEPSSGIAVRCWERRK